MFKSIKEWFKKRKEKRQNKKKLVANTFTNTSNVNEIHENTWDKATTFILGVDIMEDVADSLIDKKSSKESDYSGEGGQFGGGGAGGSWDTDKKPEPTKVEDVSNLYSTSSYSTSIHGTESSSSISESFSSVVESISSVID